MSMGHSYSGQAVVWELARVGVGLTDSGASLGSLSGFWVVEFLGGVWCGCRPGVSELETLRRGYSVTEAGFGLLWLYWIWEGLWGRLRPASDV